MGRKLRKQPTKQFCQRGHFDDEPGDRLFDPQPQLEGAYIIDLVQSNGWAKRALGELTPKTVKKNGIPRIAELGSDGFWYWKK